MLLEYRRAIYGAYMSNNAQYRAARVGAFGKLMALLLVFILILAPLRGLLAEEGSEGQQSGQEQNQGQGDGSSGDEGQPPTNDPQTPPPSGDPEFDPEAEDTANPPTEVPPQPNDSKFSNKRVVLAQTDESSGALSYVYPLTFAPGRSGLTPDLSLTYNSQAATHGSIVGDGWSLSIPTIERTNKTGFQQLYSGNFFTSSLSGELVNTNNSEWRARVDNGDFATYTFDGSQWTMTDKNGTIYTFGSSAAGRQDDPADSNRIYKWFLQDIRDTNGNFIRYEYFKDQGQVYPDTIRYTGHGSDTGLFSITFTRSLNADATTQYYAGFPVTSRYRIMSASGFVDGALAHRYELTHVNGDNGGRALLHSITETGWSNATATALPPTTFDYGQRSGNGWGASSSEWQSPIDLRVGVMIMDLNGDALPDLIQSSLRLQQWTKSVYLNNGHGGWTQTTDFEAPVVFNFEWPTSPEDNGVREADLNGDGRADLIQSFSTIGHTEQKAFLNTGSGWEEVTEIWGYQHAAFADNGGFDTEARIVDLNADGLSDIVQVSQRYGNLVYINNGHGWDDESLLWTIPVRFYGGGTIIGDVNGDKLPDLLESRTLGSQQLIETYINTGNRSWALSDDYLAPTWFGGYDGEFGVRGADVNGDGLLDLIQRRENPEVIYHAWINNGHGWTENDAWIPPLPISYINSGADTATRLVDIDGDGMVDMFRAFVQAGHSAPTTWLYKNAQSATDAITDITLPEGGHTAVTYRSSATYATPTGERLNPKLPMTLSLVSRVTQTDNFGYAASKDYEYALGKYYFNTNLDRRFSGFGRVTVTDGSGNRTITSYHGGTQDEPALGQYQDHIAKAGKPYRSETRSAAGTLLARTISTWDRYDAGSGRNFVKLIRQVEQSFAPNGAHSDSAETYAYDNATGNKTGVQSWGEVTGSDDGTFADMGSDAYATTMTYAANAAAGIYGLPAMMLTIDQNNAKVSETRSYYDNLPLGQATAGNQTKQEQWIAGSAYAASLKTYNAYGLPLTQTDPRGKVTSYAYDTPVLYPASVTNPASQTTSYLYDYSSGQVRQLTDPNGSVFVTAYDGLGRPKQEWQPDRSNPVTPVLKAEYEYTDTSNAKRVRQLSYLDAGNAVERYTYFDGFGRPIQERSEAAAAGSFNVRDIAYTDGDLPLKESLPYASSGSARTAPATTASLYTIYAYDALKRPLSATNAVGATLTAYNGWKTLVTDADGKKKELWRDAYGNLAKVREENDKIYYTTTYQYNGLKKLVKLSDALGNIRNFVYDGLGRATLSEDLHAPADTEFGVWSYEYDAAGNMTNKTDPLGQTTSYAYDDLNRVTSEDSSTAAGIEASYEYDTCANGIGRLCAAGNDAASTAYAYDALGGLAAEQRNIAGGDYATSYTYDRQGNPLSIENPDGSSVRYTYDASGRSAKIERKEASDEKYVEALSSVTYNALGLPLVLTYGNGAVLTNTYNAAQLYRLSRRVTVTNGQTLQDLAYAYDPVGNITRIVDASNTQSAKTTDYAYDDLHRLLSATITGAADTTLDGPLGNNSVQTFAYDPIGNITYKSDVGTYLYEGTQPGSYANPHAVTSINGEEYTYDRNGNMAVTPEGQRYHWDYNNRLIAVDTATGTSSYTYDTNGQRVSSTTPALATYYPSATYSTDGTTPDKHIFLGDTAIATVRGTDKDAVPYSIQTDHLTGSNITTDASGNLAELTDYYAFGTMRIDSQTGDFTEKRKFTGHEYDADTGLTYANARYYDARIGKFLSQDSIFIDITNQKEVEQKTQTNYSEYLASPQILNSYSYVANNPLKYKDQTGDFLFLVVPVITYAPVWIPAVITASAAVGAGIASWNLGASIGHLMEGNTQASNQSLNKVESSLLGTAFIAGSALEATALISAPSKQKSASPNLKGSQNPVVKESALRGIEAHKAEIYPAGFQKEVSLPSLKRMDAYNAETKQIIELKPNNPSAISRGLRQLNQYCVECNQTYGEGHTGQIRTYEPSKIKTKK